MSSPLPEILMNGQLAKERLEEVFDMTSREHRAPPITGNVPVTTDQNEPAKWQRPARDLTRPREVLPDWIRNEGRPKRSGRTKGDMTISSFTLALLLIATISAAYADHPVFWLSIGPVPFASARFASETDFCSLAVLMASQNEASICISSAPVAVRNTPRSRCSSAYHWRSSVLSPT